MNRWPLHPLLLLMALCLSGCDVHTKDPYLAKNRPPVVPAVFLLCRSDIDRKMADEIVHQANRQFFEAGKPYEVLENIIVVDEGQYWCVSYHPRGNGATQVREGPDNVINIDGPLACYLRKSDLKLCDPPPNCFIMARHPWLAPK